MVLLTSTCLQLRFHCPNLVDRFFFPTVGCNAEGWTKCWLYHSNGVVVVSNGCSSRTESGDDWRSVSYGKSSAGRRHQGENHRCTCPLVTKDSFALFIMSIVHELYTVVSRMSMQCRIYFKTRMQVHISKKCDRTFKKHQNK